MIPNAVSKSIDNIKYTHDEVFQARHRIGVLSEVESRQARTRNYWWGSKPSTTEWCVASQITGAAQIFVWTPTFRNESTKSRKKKKYNDEWRALPRLLCDTKDWELTHHTRGGKWTERNKGDRHNLFWRDVRYMLPHCHHIRKDKSNKEKKGVVNALLSLHSVCFGSNSATGDTSNVWFTIACGRTEKAEDTCNLDISIAFSRTEGAKWLRGAMRIERLVEKSASVSRHYVSHTLVGLVEK